MRTNLNAWLLIWMTFLLSGCLMLDHSKLFTPVQIEITPITPAPSHTPTPISSPLGLNDVADVMQGVCFEAAFDAAGQVFVLRSSDELTRFFDGVDNSRLCRRAIKREPFDFSKGQIIAGLWSYGWGCKAGHEVLETVRDETAKTITLRLRLVIEGECNYELLRPYWISIHDVQDYQVRIEVE